MYNTWQGLLLCWPHEIDYSYMFIITSEMDYSYIYMYATWNGLLLHTQINHLNFSYMNMYTTWNGLLLHLHVCCIKWITPTTTCMLHEMDYSYMYICMIHEMVYPYMYHVHEYHLKWITPTCTCIPPEINNPYIKCIHVPPERNYSYMYMYATWNGYLVQIEKEIKHHIWF